MNIMASFYQDMQRFWRVPVQAAASKFGSDILKYCAIAISM